MPYNITSGSTVEFTVEFLDVSGNLTVPSSATLQLSYTDTAGAAAVDTISMTPSGSFFSATWGSGVAALGRADYSITAPGLSNATIGQLRLID